MPAPVITRAPRCTKFSRALMALALLLAAGFVSTPAAAQTSAKATGPAATVIMYHRFGETDYPSTNVTLDMLESHIKELTSGKYNVLPLPVIIDALRAGKTLPDRAVGLSADDAYLSVYKEAWPRLKAAGLPFTLFVATGPVNRKHTNYMSWEQIREMAAQGVTIGSQTSSHPHMPKGSLAANRRELEQSNLRFEKEIGKRPDLFAYPFGEASLSIMGLVRDTGFTAAFGQHSGSIGPTEPLYYLPRFAMNEKYGDIKRLRTAINTLPLAVTDMLPVDPQITTNNPPAIGFTIAPGIKNIDRISCFTSHEGQVKIERLGESRIEVRMTKPFPKGRTRLNCTLPAGQGRFHWLGRQYYFAG